MSETSQPAVERTEIETSRYVTVVHQFKETENGDPGDRFVVHGERLDDFQKIDDDVEGFVPIARPIAIIDVGAELPEDGVSEWCNSHAGKAALNQFFPDIEPDDPTLPDSEEYLEGDDL